MSGPSSQPVVTPMGNQTMDHTARIALSLRELTMNDEPESPGASMSAPTDLMFGWGVHPQGVSRMLDMLNIPGIATSSEEQTPQSVDAISFAETLAMPSGWAPTQLEDQLLEQHMNPAQAAFANCSFMDSSGECSFTDPYCTWK
jgi:hypothetical protein